MKIVWMNPHLGSDSPLVKELSSFGLTVLVCANGKEAWSHLQSHGRTVDLAIVHREGPSNDSEGMSFLKRVKEDPNQTDLPILLTSEQWEDTKFSEHQSSAFGANAYLHWPVSGEKILEVIRSIFPTENLASAPAETSPALTQATAAVTSYLSPPPVSNEAVIEPPPEIPSEEPTRITAPDLEGNVTSISLMAAPLEVPPELTPELTPELPTRNIELGSPATLQFAIETPTIEPQLATAISPIPEGLPPIELEPGTKTGINYEPRLENSLPIDESEIVSEMPYLFGGANPNAAGNPAAAHSSRAAFNLSQPVGDAVVPGGAANSPDAETLKKYLLLREQDVAVLSTQLQTAHEQVHTLEQTLKMERARNAELTLLVEQQNQRISGFEQEKVNLEASFQADVGELKFQLKAKSDKARQLEQQVRDASAEVERIRERVRTDFRKVRAREKDLENRLEIVKKDSEALILAREGKIIELKRKVDLLEFNMDLLQDHLSREKEANAELRERLAKAAQVIRVAGGLLDPRAAAELAQAVDADMELGTGPKSGAKMEKKAS